MSNPVYIDPLSAIAIRVECFFQGQELSVASGFLYTLNKKIYLITNWHVVSGRHPDNGKCLSSNAAIPDRLKLYIKDINFNYLDGFIPLYKDDCMETPIWLEHPVHSKKVDVVAVDITSYLNCEQQNLFFINNLVNTPIKLDVGKDLFIVGYPKGIHYGPILPIWKRGTFASEPKFNVDDLPKILIDSATKEGMSGSPVVIKSWGNFEDEDGSQVMSLGAFYRFIGIYSGRYRTENIFEAQIGFVWKESVISEIILQKA